MRNIIRVLVLGVVLLISFFFLKNLYIEHNIMIKDNSLSWSIKYKGVKDSVDFTTDLKGNYFIAYDDRIQFVDKKGKSYDILRDKNLKIKSLVYNENKLYYSSKDKVLSYDLTKKEQKVLIDNLPNYGDYKDSILKIKDNELYITIGAATNSGVVGSDNAWLKSSPFNYDISPKDVTINGKSFGSEKTGAFVPYKTKNTSGQVISGHFPGNASIITYNIKNGDAGNYAWGIRNIKGISFKSDGKLLAAVGGLEDRGLRAVKGDVDYIYEIKKGFWYGWPDYSGGDPITSPRFKGVNNNRLSFILDNHPSTNPPAPIYTHKNLSALGVLDIDNKGTLGEKDSIYFYDSRDNIIYGLTTKGILYDMIAFNNNSKIGSLKIYEGSILVLDNSEGVIYKINKKDLNNLFNFSSEIIYYLLIVIGIAIIIIVWKLISTINKNTKDIS